MPRPRLQGRLTRSPGTRAWFFELPEAKVLVHNEEHLALETDQASRFAVGDALYAIPFHVCPTCALHREAIVIENGRATDRVASRRPRPLPGNLIAPMRLSTGVPGLDDLLGGGLLPGTLTVVVGSTRHRQDAVGPAVRPRRLAQEGRRGIIFDMTGRATRRTIPTMPGGCSIGRWLPPTPAKPSTWWASSIPTRPGDYLHVFDAEGRRVTRRDLDFDAWHDWQAELARRLNATIAFFYGNFFVRVAPGGDRRHRAGRSAQRLGPDRAVRVRLSPDPAQGPGVGRPRPVPRALPRERRRGRPARSTIRAQIGCMLLLHFARDRRSTG